MHWEKKICIRLTLRRLVIAMLVTTSLVNLAIVGAAYEASTPPAAASATPVASTQPPVNLTATSPAAAHTQPGATFTPPPVTSPTLTLAATETPTNLPTVGMCLPNSSWPVYIVRVGDTLDSIAHVIASSADELRQANCLADDRIQPGQTLYVPRTPPPPPTFTTSPTPSAPAIVPTEHGPSAVPTDAYTPLPVTPSTDTPTPTTPVPAQTVFLDPSAELALCPASTDNLFASVTAQNPLGIQAVSAFYSLDSGETGEIILVLAEGRYSGGIYLSGDFNTDTRVSMSFRAIDALGIDAWLTGYATTVLPCIG
jgi:LysM repeat protein